LVGFRFLLRLKFACCLGSPRHWNCLAERQRLSTEEYTARLLKIHVALEDLVAHAGPIHVEGDSARAAEK
jgi:hypothetical protein